MAVDETKVLLLAREWLKWDQDLSTRTEVEDLISENAVDELHRRFLPRITFGTAGLRARVESGFARMNSLVVLQTSQGLAQHLVDTVPSAKDAGVVIGFDGRRDSRHFAEVAAAAFTAMGFKIIWYEEPAHTPLVPFGVRQSRAAAGVMITASHNPKDDNGYKVYGANGCQINDPEDKMIARAILSNLEPLSWNFPKMHDQRERMANIYFERVASLGRLENIPRFVYTPMHGVGLRYLEGALKVLTGTKPGFHSEFAVVAEQAVPDPNFPTVKFPNPEEEGALDLAKQHADRLGIDLIIANDPDADRLAIAQKVAGAWYQFKGDEVGVLLGYFMYQKHKDDLNLQGPLVMLNSAVSSQMLGVIGGAEGFVVEETLTGFKWLGNRALQIGGRAIFAYEEALGYLVPSIGYDKDGVAAAALLLQACKSWNSLPYAVMQDLYQKYGHFETMNTYWTSPNLALTKETLGRILEDPSQMPAALGPAVTYRVRNLVDGTDTASADGRAALPSSADNLMITLWLTGDARVCEGARCTIRASGTEPKLKGKSGSYDREVRPVR